MSQKIDRDVQIIFSELKPKNYSELEIEKCVQKYHDKHVFNRAVSYEIILKLLNNAWEKYKSEGLKLTDNGIFILLEALGNTRLGRGWGPGKTSQQDVFNLFIEIWNAREKLKLTGKTIKRMFEALASVISIGPGEIDVLAVYGLINEIWNDRKKLLLSDSTICSMFWIFSHLTNKKQNEQKWQEKIDRQAFFNLINEIWNEQVEDVGVNVLSKYTFKALAHVIDAGHGEIDEQPVLELINKILDKYERAKIRYKKLKKTPKTDRKKSGWHDQYLKATEAIELDDQDIRQMFKALAKAIDKGQGKINKQSIVTLIARVLNMPRDIYECKKLYLSSKTIKYMFGALTYVINKSKGEIDKQTILKLIDKAWAEELCRDDPSKFMLMALTYAVGKNSEQVEKQISEPSILKMVNALLENPQKLQLTGNVISFMFTELIHRMVTGEEKIGEQIVLNLINKILDSCEESQLTDSAIKWIFVSFVFASAIKKETTENILSLIGCTRDILKLTTGLNDAALVKIFDVLKNKLGKEAIEEISIMIAQMQNINELAKNKLRSLLLELEKKEVKKEKDEKQEKYNTEGDIKLGRTLFRFFDNDHELLERFNKKLKELSVSTLKIIELFLSNHERLHKKNKNNVIESLFFVLIYRMVNGQEKIDEQDVDTVFQLVNNTMNMKKDLKLPFDSIQWMFTALTFAIATQKETRENIVYLAGKIGDILEMVEERFDTEHLNETLNALIYMSENETVKKISNVILNMQDTEESVNNAYLEILIELGRKDLIEREANENDEDNKAESQRENQAEENNVIINAIDDGKNAPKITVLQDDVKNGEEQSNDDINGWEKEGNGKQLVKKPEENGKLIDDKINVQSSNKMIDQGLAIDLSQMLESPKKESKIITEKKLNEVADDNQKSPREDQNQQPPTRKQTGIIAKTLDFIIWTIIKFLLIIKNAFLAILNWFKQNSNKKTELAPEKIEIESLDNNFKQARTLSEAQNRNETRNNEVNNFYK